LPPDRSRAAVAPHGGFEPLLGTKPHRLWISVTRRSGDLGCHHRAMSHSTLRKRATRGERLAEGTAFDAAGGETARSGGGVARRIARLGRPSRHRPRRGRATVRVLCGAPMIVDGPRGFGFFFLAFKPDLLMPAATFKRRVAAFATRIRGSKRRTQRRVCRSSVRRRSGAQRRQSGIVVADEVHRAIVALAIKKTKGAPRVRRRSP